MLDRIVDIALEAGREIMRVYGSGDFAVEYKGDSSPLTAADKASHEVIERGLRLLAPAVPVISEEGSLLPYAERAVLDRFWLVDPLDGTKEFIKRNGEFTVNIALIEDRRPVAGVIYAPAKGLLYYAGNGSGAFRSKDGQKAEALERRKSVAGPVRVAISRSHPSKATDDFLKGFEVATEVSAGSSLKFCLVAEGSADLYPRFGETWEWDTAAGHAIAAEAGARVTLPDGGELLYNKETLKQPGFIVSAVAGPQARSAR